MTAELMARAQAGDLDAFGELYAKYRPYVHRLAYKMLPAHADDITQDVFVKALAKLDSWHDQGKDPLAWLNTITVNLCHSKARSAHEQRSRPVSFDDVLALHVREDRPGPEDLVVGDLSRRELRAALADLTREQREVIVLTHYEGLRVLEVAQRLGLHENAVKSRLYRARRVLGALLAERGLAHA